MGRYDTKMIIIILLNLQNLNLIWQNRKGGQYISRQFNFQSMISQKLRDLLSIAVSNNELISSGTAKRRLIWLLLIFSYVLPASIL